MNKNFEETNKRLNLETQTIADKITTGSATERDRNRLVEIIYPKLRFYIYKFFNNNDHTDEALHNTIEKIFKGMHLYNNKWKFTTWIYNIAKNEALLYRHKLKESQTTEIETVSFLLNSVDTSDQVSIKENALSDLYQITVTAIMSMPDSIEKQILIDKEINLLKGAEISEKHQMNLNTVKTKLRKARKQIKDQILVLNPSLNEIVNQYL